MAMKNISVCRAKIIWLVGAFAILLALSVYGQKQSKTPKDMPEMQLTEAGLLAIDTPKGWIRGEGPGLAFFLREGDDPHTTESWIYISGSPIGSKEEDKDADAYIQSDIAGFKKRFPAGAVEKEVPLFLPHAKVSVRVLTFRSGEEHNSFEQVIYLPEAERVLTLTLSAKTGEAFQRSLTAFHEFAKSYRGSISISPSASK
jgi:hypothetical protein